MAVRNFGAPDGSEWNVWEVVPEEMTDPRGSGSHLPQEMVDGWLCFATDGEKRRLYPRPLMWHEETDEQLWRLCETAVPVVPRTEKSATDELPDSTTGV
jgi:hypothetical protein